MSRGARPVAGTGSPAGTTADAPCRWTATSVRIGIGRTMPQPCAASTPSSRIRSSAAGVSTHSATVGAPAARATRTIESTIWRSSGPSSTARTSEPSIFTRSGAKPSPPRTRTSVLRIAPSMPVIGSDSVISSSIVRGATPVAARRPNGNAGNPGSATVGPVGLIAQVAVQPRGAASRPWRSSVRATTCRSKACDMPIRASSARKAAGGISRPASSTRRDGTSSCSRPRVPSARTIGCPSRRSRPSRTASRTERIARSPPRSCSTGGADSGSRR